MNLIDLGTPVVIQNPIYKEYGVALVKGFLETSFGYSKVQVVVWDDSSSPVELFLHPRELIPANPQDIDKTMIRLLSQKVLIESAVKKLEQAKDKL